MTGTTRSSSDLDIRRRKVLFRSWHRGTREMDLVLGRFADDEIESMSDEDLADYERLMDEPDRELFAWVSGAEAVPARHDTPVFQRVRAFEAAFGKDRS